jgi:hypothetical protein
LKNEINFDHLIALEMESSEFKPKRNYSNKKIKNILNLLAKIETFESVIEVPNQNKATCCQSLRSDF